MGIKVSQSENGIFIIADDIVAQPIEGYDQETRKSDGIQNIDKATGLPVWALRGAVMHGANLIAKKIKIVAAEQPSGFTKGGQLIAQGLDINLYEMTNDKGFTNKGWTVSADSLAPLGASPATSPRTAPETPPSRRTASS